MYSAPAAQHLHLCILFSFCATKCIFNDQANPFIFLSFLVFVDWKLRKSSLNAQTRCLDVGFVEYKGWGDLEAENILPLHPVRPRLTFQSPQSPSQAVIPRIVDTAAHKLLNLTFCIYWPSSLEAGFGEEKLAKYWLCSKRWTHWSLLTLFPFWISTCYQLRQNEKANCNQYTFFQHWLFSTLDLHSYFSKHHLDNRTQSVWKRKWVTWYRLKIKKNSQNTAIRAIFWLLL